MILEPESGVEQIEVLLEKTNASFRRYFAENREKIKKMKLSEKRLQESLKRKRNEQKVRDTLDSAASSSNGAKNANNYQVSKERCYRIKKLFFSRRVTENEQTMLNIALEFANNPPGFSDVGLSIKKIAKIIEGIQICNNEDNAKTLKNYFHKVPLKLDTSLSVQSRRIDKENRFVYQFNKKTGDLYVLQVPGHYND